MLKAFIHQLAIGALLFTLTSSLTQAKGDLLKTLPPEKAGFSAERFNRLAELTDNMVVDAKYSGIVTLIARDGRIIHHQAAGTFGVENGKPVEKDSLFRIYSMTKPITAVAAMILLEQGKLHLDDPISDYLPQFGEVRVLVGEDLQQPETPITIRHLLTHTAGMTYGWEPNNPVEAKYAEATLFSSRNLSEFVEKLSALPLRFQPGQRYHYSVAIDVLGAIIEKVSNQPLDVFFKTQIFEPLNMHNTFFEVPEDQLHRLLEDEVWDAEQQRIVPVPTEQQFRFDAVSLIIPGGGLVSTAEDYFRFCQMILNGGELNGRRLLSPKTIELMSMNHLSEAVLANSWNSSPRPNLSRGQGMGFGFGVVINAASMPALSSNGELSWGGLAGTKFWIDPKEKIIGIALVQLYRSPWPLREDLKNATYQALEQLH